MSLALAEAKQRGATQADVDASMNRGLSTTVRLGEVETVEYQRDRGIGVTVYFGKRKGSASTADLSAKAVRETVEKSLHDREVHDGRRVRRARRSRRAGTRDSRPAAGSSLGHQAG